MHDDDAIDAILAAPLCLPAAAAAKAEQIRAHQHERQALAKLRVILM